VSRKEIFLAIEQGPGFGKPVRDSFRVLGIFIRGQVLLCLILAILYAAAFALLRVPYWYIIAPVGGLACVIPRIGSLIPLGLAVLALDPAEAGMRRIVILLAAWLLIQGIEFFVLMPRLISRPLGLKELPVLAALLFGSLIFGPIGLVLAVPVLAIGTVFWRHLRRRPTR
jgi:predicted PurR-regulated permease PerM